MSYNLNEYIFIFSNINNLNLSNFYSIKSDFDPKMKRKK